MDYSLKITLSENIQNHTSLVHICMHMCQYKLGKTKPEMKIDIEF